MVIIPAYEPSMRMINLIEKLKLKCDYDIVIIDAGSGKNYNNIFKLAKELGCTVITENINKGKGYALKVDFKYIETIYLEENKSSCFRTFRYSAKVYFRACRWSKE